MGCMRTGNKRLPLSGCLAPNPGRRARLLADLYGLTPAEAAVALAAAEGHTAERIATDRATTVNTIRTQLRRALEKSGAANLRELTRIVTLMER
jgi:DNA-binding CsgD family transcriptional regulator